VGLDPFGGKKTSPGDIAMVVAAFVVCAGLLVWAVLG
jgi:hypothetical protein